MTKSEWKKRYKAQLIESAGITSKFAEETYQAGLDNHDFYVKIITKALLALLRGER